MNFRFLLTRVCVLALLFVASCIRLDRAAEPVESSGNGPDAGSRSSEKAPSVAHELAEATIEVCEAPLHPPRFTCIDRDDAEPNDMDNPVLLPVQPTCGYVQANISAGDDDAYRFTTRTSDPVRIELLYDSGESDGDADLEQLVYGPTGSLLTNERNERMGSGEYIRSLIHSDVNATYVVRVRDSSSNEGCQSYTLRVDPMYCSDLFEDNDSLDTAVKLLWDTSERVTVIGALLESDDDFFEVTTVRADPVLLSGSYTATAVSSVQVARSVLDAAGSLQVDALGERKTDMETFSHWVPVPEKGSVLRTRLSASGDGCASYKLTLDAAACTDEYEDNDRSADAAMLSVGVDAKATIYSSDEDYYALKPLRTGSCNLTYDIPSGRNQQLTLAVLDGAGNVLGDDNRGDLNGSVGTLKVSWTDHDAIRVSVRANESGYCQPYTLRCDAAEGGQ
jgi:hypothetical protein